MGGRRASRSLADGGDGHGARPQTCGLWPEMPGWVAVEGKGSQREEPSTALLTRRTGCHRLKWRVQEEKRLWGVGDAGRRRPKGNTSRVGTVGSITCVEFFSLSPAVAAHQTRGDRRCVLPRLLPPLPAWPHKPDSQDTIATRHMGFPAQMLELFQSSISQRMFRGAPGL